MNANVMQWLGQTSTQDALAWEAYIKALRSSLNQSWNEAANAYATLKLVREQFGLPFIVNQGGSEASAAPGMSAAAAWQTDLEQQAKNVMGMVALASNALGDVILPEGDPKKRNLLWDPARKDFGIQALPGDPLRLEAQNGVPVLINTQTNQPTNIETTIGVGAIPLFIVGAAAAGVVVQTIGVVLIVKAACETLQTVSEQKTLRTAIEKQAELVQSGKATPEQAQNMSKAVFAGATELSRAKAEEAKAKKPASPTDWSKLITAGTWLAVAVGGIYLLTRVVPSRGTSAPTRTPRSRQLAPAYGEN